MNYKQEIKSVDKQIKQHKQLILVVQRQSAFYLNKKDKEILEVEEQIAKLADKYDELMAERIMYSTTTNSLINSFKSNLKDLREYRKDIEEEHNNQKQNNKEFETTQSFTIVIPHYHYCGNMEGAND